VQATIPLATPDGKSQDYQLGANGVEVKPQFPPMPEGLGAPLSTSKSGDLLRNRQMFFDIQGFKLPDKTGYIHIHVNFDGPTTQLTRTTSLNASSYAGSRPFIPLSSTEEGRPAIDMSIDITKRVRELDMKLSDQKFLVIPFSRTGEQLAEPIPINRLMLRMQ
jgi:hypothetical protein